MGKPGICRILLDRLCLSCSGCAASSCLCFNEEHKQHAANRDEDFDVNEEDEDEGDNKPLIVSHLLRIRDVISAPPTLALHLKPKIVELKVSMHCNGCARQVEKHISKMEGVTSYRVELETKRVVVIGDIGPFEVLKSISKVKYAEFWEIQTVAFDTVI